MALSDANGDQPGVADVFDIFTGKPLNGASLFDSVAAGGTRSKRRPFGWSAKHRARIGWLQALGGLRPTGRVAVTTALVGGSVVAMAVALRRRLARHNETRHAGEPQMPEVAVNAPEGGADAEQVESAAAEGSRPQAATRVRRRRVSRSPRR